MRASTTYRRSRCFNRFSCPQVTALAAPGGFLRFLETGHDSDSTDQMVNTDGPVPAAVTVNKTR